MEIWYLTVVGLFCDLFGAVIVLAPDWESLDNRIKELGHKLEFFSVIPILGYPFSQLDRAYRLDYCLNYFFNNRNSLEDGDFGFSTLREVIENQQENEYDYDILSAPPNNPGSGSQISRVQSDEYRERNDINVIGSTAPGPDITEAKHLVEQEVSRTMFRVGGSLLAIGFSLQILSTILQKAFH